MFKVPACGVSKVAFPDSTCQPSGSANTGLKTKQDIKIINPARTNFLFFTKAFIFVPQKKSRPKGIIAGLIAPRKIKNPKRHNAIRVCGASTSLVTGYPSLTLRAL
jgi:hypothetical protein